MDKTCAFEEPEEPGELDEPGDEVGPFAYAPVDIDVTTLVPASPFVVECDVTLDSATTPPILSAPECIPGANDQVFTDLPDGSLAVVVDGLEVSAGTVLQLIGPRPVTFVVFGDAAVVGTILAHAGPATTAQCGAARGRRGSDHEFGAAGGGGGGRLAQGGRGGGSLTPNEAGVGGEGGRSIELGRAGGCAGGYGGFAGVAVSVPGGEAAEGGGAVQLAVAGSLRVDGVIASPGHGGGGARGADAGGGGGGSGGRVLLEADILILGDEAAVTANGGGGGGGGGGTRPAAPGSDGALDSAAAAPGGAGGTASTDVGGDGALGGAGLAPQGGDGVNDADGAGGGGGAAGVILLRARTCNASDSAIVSPPTECALLSPS